MKRSGHGSGRRNCLPIHAPAVCCAKPNVNSRLKNDHGESRARISFCITRETQLPRSCRQQLLATMETEFQDVASQLGYEPAENIIVILYTQKEFVDITQAPSWAGAMNDGKLRIPIRGVNAMNSRAGARSQT